LNATERNVLAQMLPTEGHYADMDEVRRLRSYLTYTVEEMKQFGMEPTADGRLHWDDTQDSVTYVKDIPCSEWVTHTIQALLIKADFEGKLKEWEITLFEKFVRSYQNL